MNNKIIDGLKLILEGVTEEDSKKPEPAPPKKEKKAKEQTEVSVDDVRVVLAQKSQDGLTEKVRELLESYGAAKLSSVDPDKLPELLESAKALE